VSCSRISRGTRCRTSPCASCRLWPSRGGDLRLGQQDAVSAPPWLRAPSGALHQVRSCAATQRTPAARSTAAALERLPRLRTWPGCLAIAIAPTACSISTGVRFFKIGCLRRISCKASFRHLCRTFLEAVEAVPARAHHPAGLADVPNCLAHSSNPTFARITLCSCVIVLPHSGDGRGPALLEPASALRSTSETTTVRLNLNKTVFVSEGVRHRQRSARERSPGQIEPSPGTRISPSPRHVPPPDTIPRRSTAPEHGDMLILGLSAPSSPSHLSSPLRPPDLLNLP